MQTRPLPRSRIARALALLQLRDLRLSREACSACGSRLQVRLSCADIAVRCVFCRASAVSQSIVDVVRRRVANLHCCDAYELSDQGHLLRFLRKATRSVIGSELLDGVPCGSMRDGTTSQDIQRLTFGDDCFDLCTSTEVFEHVEDDIAGFRETYRVLRPRGHMIFTVPISGDPETTERTTIIGGRRVNTLPAEFHHDRHHEAGVFCYRNYGRDIGDRLRGVGFINTEIVAPKLDLFGLARHVVAAQKPW